MPTPLSPLLGYVEVTYTYLSFNHRFRLFVDVEGTTGAAMIASQAGTGLDDLTLASFWQSNLSPVFRPLLTTASVITSVTAFQQQATPGQFLPLETVGLSVNGTSTAGVLLGTQLTMTFRDGNGVFVRYVVLEGASSQYTPGSAQTLATPEFVEDFSNSVLNTSATDLGGYVYTRARGAVTVYRSWQSTLNRKILRERGI